jgi:hypothetical protein
MIDKNVEWWIEWVSTAVLIIGVALTAYNVYPLNIWLSLLGNIGWFVIGWMWKKYSLLTIQVVISIIYILGLMSYYGVW